MLSKIVLRLFFLLFVYQYSYSNVIYEKNNLIITEIDIKVYQKIYKENYNLDINETNSLKDLIIINNVIKNLEINNTEFINNIDSEILIQFGEEALEDETVRNFLRFSRLRDEFLINYFQNKLEVKEVIDIFQKLDYLNLPISIDNCLIIKEIVDLKDNKEFVENFYYNLKQNTKDFQIKINNVVNKVCINDSTFKTIEKLIVDYIQIKTAEEFEKFAYEKIKN